MIHNLRSHWPRLSHNVHLRTRRRNLMLLLYRDRPTWVFGKQRLPLLECRRRRRRSQFRHHRPRYNRGSRMRYVR